jgi:hypothetical protein
MLFQYSIVDQILLPLTIPNVYTITRPFERPNPILKARQKTLCQLRTKRSSYLRDEICSAGIGLPLRHRFVDYGFMDSIPVANLVIVHVELIMVLQAAQDIVGWSQLSCGGMIICARWNGRLARIALLWSGMH